MVCDCPEASPIPNWSVFRLQSFCAALRLKFKPSKKESLSTTEFRGEFLNVGVSVLITFTSREPVEYSLKQKSLSDPL